MVERAWLAMHPSAQLLGEAFCRLEKHDFRLKQGKCQFLRPRVEYLGHQISSDCIRPLQTKTVAILKAPVPGNIQKLKSFMGLRQSVNPTTVAK